MEEAGVRGVLSVGPMLYLLFSLHTLFWIGLMINVVFYYREKVVLYKCLSLVEINKSIVEELLCSILI